MTAAPADPRAEPTTRSAPIDLLRGPAPVETRDGPPADAAVKDRILAAALLVGAILSAWLGLAAGIYTDEAASVPAALIYGLVLTLPLALRRRFPNTVLAVVSLGFFLGPTLRVPDLYAGQIALFIAFYTVGAWDHHRRRAALVRAVVIVAMFTWLLIVMFQEVTEPDSSLPPLAGAFSPFAAFLILQILVNTLFFAGAYYLGNRAYTDAVARRTLEQRSRELEDEREVTGAQAVALDRVRIARELHDVVAHHVSAMGVQAGAARAVLERDPAAAREAMLGVEESARSALTDLRQLLETLRTPGGEPWDGSPVRLDGIADLVAHANDNGLPTTFVTVGEPIDPPEVVQVNLYRVAQEALTNARRHSGPNATAEVRLRFDDEAIELEVLNTGRVVTASRAGLGIVGMRERAAASGGTLETRVRARGGFLVRVRVPLRTGATA